MSKVFASLVTMSGKTLGGKEPVAIPDSETYGSELVESTGTSIPSTVKAGTLAKSDELVWLVRGVSGKSFVKFGATPTAVVGDGWYVAEGDLIAVSAKFDDRFAVIQTT